MPSRPARVITLIHCESAALVAGNPVLANRAVGFFFAAWPKSFCLKPLGNAAPRMKLLWHGCKNLVFTIAFPAVHYCAVT